MADQSELEMRINGRAVFAAAAFLICVGLTFILARIGAPDALVHNLGPAIALFALALIGVLARSSRVDAVFSADRLASPTYGAAALAAIAAGLAVCFFTDEMGDYGPLAAMPAGVLVGAIVIGPLARRTGASSLSDLLSARFPSRVLRLIFAVAYFAIGTLIAAGGFETAVSLLSSFVGVSRETAIGVIAVTVILIVTPGGLAGLLWAGAAAAGVIVAVFLAPILTHLSSGGGVTAMIWRAGGEIAALLAGAWSQFDRASPQARGLDAVAVAAGFAAIPPVLTAAFVSSTEVRAMRAGLLGALFAAILALAYFVGRPLWNDTGNLAAAGLRGSAGLVAAVLCACAGAHTASRAVGVEGKAYGLGTVLASRRLAGARQLAVLAVALCGFFSYRRAIEPSAALLDAAALSLAATVPALGLAASARASAVHVLAGIVVSLAAIVGLAELQGWDFVANHAPATALNGAAAGFAVGWAASLFGGRRDGSLADGPLRPFVETPPDPGA
jgi:cation/acetate symporter